MHIKSELLWGDSIRDRGRLYDLLQEKKLPSGYYLLLAVGDKLEFIPARMQENRYILSRDCLVFGMAHGKKEACEMICRIMTRIYVEHIYESVADFIREITEEAVCLE